MIFKLISIVKKSRLKNGVTKANGFTCNGYVYEFENDKGEIYTKYSYNIMSSLCKYRISIADDILELQKNYIKAGMINEAQQLEEDLPYEGDIYDFKIYLKKGEIKNRISTIRKSN